MSEVAKNGWCPGYHIVNPGKPQCELKSIPILHCPFCPHGRSKMPIILSRERRRLTGGIHRNHRLGPGRVRRADSGEAECAARSMQLVDFTREFVGLPAGAEACAPYWALAGAEG